MLTAKVSPIYLLTPLHMPTLVVPSGLHGGRRLSGGMPGGALALLDTHALPVHQWWERMQGQKVKTCRKKAGNERKKSEKSQEKEIILKSVWLLITGPITTSNSEFGWASAAGLFPLSLAIFHYTFESCSNSRRLEVLLAFLLICCLCLQPMFCSLL